MTPLKTSPHTPIPGKLFSRILDAVPVCTVDIIFLNKEKTKTLLFKRINEPLKGVYFSAGGRLLKNEKITDGVVRQAQRETGIRVNAKKLIPGGVQEEVHRTSAFAGASYHAIVLYYGYVIDEKALIQLDGQHSDAVWFPIGSKKIHPFIRTRLKNLLKNL